ncbi:TATA-binding protein-associated factor mot1 [Coemansia pectinata]|uniref:TATA-binding protein-associated factor mot1 n=1 Tax=Coemansia pectinata TaxID=1052879 RepID=A0A9W8H2A0_9FUNG|nr:TATA-binding protein-associated factor mot1 [Coemansia pectinata]
MTTRLDRLVGLLDTGATPVVRSTAARQIGGIQRQHPEELFRLLARVYEYIGSKSWDTRVAAAQAFDAIAKEVSEWDPPVEEDIKPTIVDDEEDLLTFAQYNVDSVIRNGRLLLGSAGKEYDDGLEGLDAQARMALQRAQMKKRLGIGAQFLDVDLLDDVDLGADSPPVTDVKRVDKRRKVEEAAPNGAESADIDMSKLSARERNRLKRKERMNGGKKKAKVDVGPKTGNGESGVVMSQTAVDVTEQPGGGAIVVEAKKADSRETLFAISSGRWAFEAVVEILCIDLFSPSWESRHGAAMALREIFRSHGFGAGRVSGLTKEENQRRNQQFLEDVCVRLVCVFTLDRFGDFVADHVVAPVRETCAQALGVVSQFLAQDALVATQKALLQLVERGGRKDAAIWEARHAGLSGLRYVVAVRRDVAALLAGGTLDAALGGLGDGDDDVRGVSAETLLPLVDSLVMCQPGRILDVVSAVWAALADVTDDLTASAASVMALLARLVSHPDVRSAVVEAGQTRPQEYALAVLVPRLFPFFRHAIAAVRRAALQTLLTFAEMPSGDAAWVDAACLRLVYQNIVLEVHDDISELSARLWLALLRLLSHGDITVDHLLAPPDVAAMFQLAATPIGVRLSLALLYDIPSTASVRHNVDAAMVQQDLGLIPRESVIRARVLAAAALGQLLAAWPQDARAAAFTGLLAQAMQSGWALQSQLASVVAEEFVMAERTQLIEAGTPVGNAMARGAVSLTADLLAPLLDALTTVLNVSDPEFRDLDRALAQVRADCSVLLDSAVAESCLAAAQAQALLPAAPGFSMAAATHICGPAFDAFATRASGDARVMLGERRLRATSSMDYHTRLRQQLNVSTAASVASAVVAIGQLPTKLNAVLRSLMTAVKQEHSPLLQARAATAVARMAALCYNGHEARLTAPADKMVRNLATFVCADPWSTPVFAQRASQTESILMLEMVQREQAARDTTTSSNGAAAASAQMAAAASASAQASQRKRRGGPSRQDESDACVAVPLVQAASASSSEEQEKEQAARLVVRGAEAAVTAIARLFGPELIRSVPRLWECVTQPLAATYSAAVEDDSADVSFGAAGSPAAQNAIDALRVLLALAPALHEELHGQLVDTLPWVLSALVSRYASVRHMAARTLAEVCAVVTPPAMQAFIQRSLPSLADTTRTHRRQGLAEAVYYVIQRLGETVLPYVTFLMVPVLGRMSDTNEQTRLVCTNCFAQLLKLVPLEADIPDPVGFPAELVAQRDHERRFLAQLMDSSKLEPFRIPVKVNATLRKYQQEGVDWLAFLNKYELHGVLCDDMGLGKTLQTICVVASDHYLRQQRFTDANAADCQPLPSLVVCPPTLISHWEQEIRHYTENLRPMCYSGPPSERRPLIPQIAANAADVVIMSYDVVRNDIELLAAQNWNYCVLDEGHVIKNARTKLTLAVKRLRARRRLVLSGTPVQNNVIELWSLFDYLMPGFLGSERQFNELYARPILASRDAKQMSTAQVAGELALKALHKQVLPFLLRRMKEDVLHDLPPKIIQDYYCELSPLQKFLYDEFAKSAVPGNLKKSLGLSGSETAGGEAAKGAPVPHVFQALQYLRKVCNHPALVLTPKHPLFAQVEGELAARGADLHSLDIAPKLQALKDLLNQCGIGLQPAMDGKCDLLDDSLDSVSASHRVLIFCQHREMIERIEQDLFTRHMPGVTYMRVDGTVEARRRQEIVTRFNSDPSIDCLLLTTHVGGLGLNLTGADTVIFVEHDYNPAMDVQAMDRAHRLGQTRVVNVYRLITRNTLEEKIMGLQAFKLHMANTIVNQQNASLASMNTDQLLDLFNVSAPKTSAPSSGETAVAGSKSIAKAIEGLEDLWDSSQYEDEFNLDGFISSLQQ